MRIGILHPGAMGAALGSSLIGEVIWASNGRSDATRERAVGAEFIDARDLSSLARTAEVIISVCPPAAAEAVAADVSRLGFEGIYVDANAISPATCHRIARLFPEFVDGGIVGPPPRDEGDTRLYLSGPEATDVARLFADARVEVRILGDEPGKASAMKAAYAGWTKASTALLLNQAAYAQAEGVLGDLIREFDESIPGLVPRLESTSTRIGLKAWRFSGEMDEIAGAMSDAGLPIGFHQAAGSIFAKLQDLKDLDDQPALTSLLAMISGSSLDD